MSRSKVRNILLLKQIHSAVAQIRKGNLEKALETLDKAEDSARKAKATDAVYYILFMRGGIYYSESKYNEALETYEKAIDAGSELLKNDPENTNYRHYMGTTLSNTGNLLKNKGEKPQAAEYYIRARETYVNLLSSTRQLNSTKSFLKKSPITLAIRPNSQLRSASLETAKSSRARKAILQNRTLKKLLPCRKISLPSSPKMQLLKMPLL